MSYLQFAAVESTAPLLFGLTFPHAPIVFRYVAATINRHMAIEIDCSFRLSCFQQTMS